MPARMSCPAWMSKRVDAGARPSSCRWRTFVAKVTSRLAMAISTPLMRHDFRFDGRGRIMEAQTNEALPCRRF